MKINPKDILTYTKNPDNHDSIFLIFGSNFGLINKIYIKHIYNVYLERLIYITIIFSSLIFIMNILEEFKFFSDNDEVGIGIPVFLTMIK